jgi:hypothetical protein
MLDLCLHTGARRVARDDVAAAPTPDRTRSWVPVPHQRLLDLVRRTLEASGLSVVNEAHALWNDGARYFGLLEVVNGTTHADYGLVVGLRNSHDKTFPAGLACGSGVFVCDNLAFSGEVKLARKHTRYIERDLPQLVARAVGRLGDLRRQQDQRLDAYRTHHITDESAHDLMVRAIDARVLPVTSLPKVVDEWREPSHEEFAADGPTVWRLFNGFTEALKGRNLAELPRRTQALHGLLDVACGIAV